MMILDEKTNDFLSFIFLTFPAFFLLTIDPGCDNHDHMSVVAINVNYLRNLR